MCIPNETETTQRTDRTERVERTNETRRGKTKAKQWNKDTYTTIGGDLSTPTYMSAHIFDWMNDCRCARTQRISVGSREAKKQQLYTQV